MSYEKIDEELIASVTSDVKAHFEKCKKEFEAKRNPEKPYLYLPKGELRKRVEEHNRKMCEAQKPPPKSDYERQLIKVVKAQPAKKKAGKGVLHLGDTSRPLSPLIVADQYGYRGNLESPLCLRWTHLKIISLRAVSRTP